MHDLLRSSFSRRLLSRRPPPIPLAAPSSPASLWPSLRQRTRPVPSPCPIPLSPNTSMSSKAAASSPSARDAQRRPRRIEPKPSPSFTEWIEKYRRIWSANFQRLDAVLALMRSLTRLNPKQRNPHAEKLTETCHEQRTFHEAFYPSDRGTRRHCAFDALRKPVFDAGPIPNIFLTGSSAGGLDHARFMRWIFARAVRGTVWRKSDGAEMEMRGTVSCKINAWNVSSPSKLWGGDCPETVNTSSCSKRTTNHRATMTSPAPPRKLARPPCKLA